MERVPDTEVVLNLNLKGFIFLFWIKTFISMKAIDTIFKHIGDKGIHLSACGHAQAGAIDRGGDRPVCTGRGVICKKYLEREKPTRFVIRALASYPKIDFVDDTGKELFIAIIHRALPA